MPDVSSGKVLLPGLVHALVWTLVIHGWAESEAYLPALYGIMLIAGMFASRLVPLRTEIILDTLLFTMTMFAPPTDASIVGIYSLMLSSAVGIVRIIFPKQMS